MFTGGIPLSWPSLHEFLFSKILTLVIASVSGMHECGVLNEAGVDITA